MDEIMETKLREMAAENDIDPDELIRLAKKLTLPNGLDEAVAAILGDVSTFGKALSKLDK